jgi:hypothetical protein
MARKIQPGTNVMPNRSRVLRTNRSRGELRRLRPHRDRHGFHSKLVSHYRTGRRRRHSRRRSCRQALGDRHQSRLRRGLEAWIRDFTSTRERWRNAPRTTALKGGRPGVFRRTPWRAFGALPLDDRFRGYDGRMPGSRTSTPGTRCEPGAADRSRASGLGRLRARADARGSAGVFGGAAAAGRALLQSASQSAEFSDG